ncbi:hypothetical protein PL78_11625 [Yersinia entomophaga]|uniref:Pilus assembly protein PilO n=1 Tax=Yersinia entomophaga TaxID=935293 RepID=A0ABM6BM01_YERET|nr:hypothetical protein [Yersinia entomophaga]ANI30470.1 hypothetical protein PL78_11625 [Yersinia entomophaga]OWF87326.1 hypothetical protein B4914_12035 [Yersinia entomophaga]
MNNYYLRWMSQSGGVLYLWLIITTLFIGFTCYAVLIRPELLLRVNEREHIETQRISLAQRQQDIAQMPTLDQLGQQREAWHLYQQLKTAENPTKSLISHIGEWVVATGGQVLRWQQLEVKNKNKVGVSQWEGLLSMDYSGAIHLLGSLKALYPPFLIEHLHITAEASGLNLRLRLRGQYEEDENDKKRSEKLTINSVGDGNGIDDGGQSSHF